MLRDLDFLGPASGFFGGYCRDEIAFAAVFNAPLSTKQMVALFDAVRWLEPETVNRVWFGDSQMQPGGSNNIAWYFSASGQHTNEFSWINHGRGGVQLKNVYSTTTRNNLFYLCRPDG